LRPRAEKTDADAGAVSRIRLRIVRTVSSSAGGEMKFAFLRRLSVGLVEFCSGVALAAIESTARAETQL
jgi:hypothetical protein